MFPHDCNNAATQGKVCWGPGPKIQVNGNPFCWKIRPPKCWDLFAEGGGRGSRGEFRDRLPHWPWRHLLLGMPFADASSAALRRACRRAAALWIGLLCPCVLQLLFAGRFPRYDVVMLHHHSMLWHCLRLSVWSAPMPRVSVRRKWSWACLGRGLNAACNA